MNIEECLDYYEHVGMVDFYARHGDNEYLARIRPGANGVLNYESFTTTAPVELRDTLEWYPY